MLDRLTVHAVTPIAESLAENNIRLEVNPNTPLGVLARHFVVDTQPTFQRLDMTTREALGENVIEANAATHELTEEEYDQIVANMAHGLSSMLNKVRGLIVPYCKEIMAMMETFAKERAVPQLEVTPANWSLIHSEMLSRIMAHQGYSLQDTYPSFVLPKPTPEKILEWVGSVDSVDGDLIKRWLLSIKDSGFDTLVIWYQLFEKGEIDPRSLPMFNPNQYYAESDHLLMGFLLCDYLIDNPMRPVNGAVTLDEWENRLKNIQAALGIALARNYTRRSQDKKDGKVVHTYWVQNYTGNEKSVEVVANGDVYPAWLEAVESPIETLLGAAVSEPSMKHATVLKDNEERLVKAWTRQHALIKQANLSGGAMRIRDYLRMLLREEYGMPDSVKELKAQLPLRDDAYELQQRVNTFIQGVKLNDVEDLWRLVTKAVCEVYYPNTPYHHFLHAMDQINKRHPQLPVREVSTLATVEMMGQWLSKQLKAYTFSPEIVQDWTTNTRSEMAPAGSPEPEESVEETPTEQASEEA